MNIKNSEMMTGNKSQESKIKHTLTDTKILDKIQDLVVTLYPPEKRVIHVTVKVSRDFEKEVLQRAKEVAINGGLILTTSAAGFNENINLVISNVDYRISIILVDEDIISIERT